MDQADWTSTFSPNAAPSPRSASGTTPYFDLNDHLSHSTSHNGTGSGDATGDKTPNNPSSSVAGPTGIFVLPSSSSQTPDDSSASQSNMYNQARRHLQQKHQHQDQQHHRQQQHHHHSLDKSTPQHFSEHEQFFLQQIEQNMYRSDASTNEADAIAAAAAAAASASAPSDAAPNSSTNNGSQFTELNLDNFNFMLPDLDFDTANQTLNNNNDHPPHQQQHIHHHHHVHHHGDHQQEEDDDDGSFPQNSTAFPPSHIPQNTPSMLARNSRILEESTNNSHSSSFSSPILLPGQNDRSFNNQHLYHKQFSNPNNTSVSSASPSSSTSARHSYSHSQARGNQHVSQHVRPDAVFTPLVSPAVTPLDNNNAINGKKQLPIQVSFEPLTSPALTAQPSLNDRRRSSSSVFAPTADEDDYEGDGHKGIGTSSNSSHSGGPHKRRTPHSTPILSANNSAAAAIKAKRSPSIKSRDHNKSVANISIPPFEKLPESGIDSGRNSIETTPMLPPQGRKKIDTGENASNSTDGTNGSNTAPTLMGFTMGRLAEQQQAADKTIKGGKSASPTIRGAASSTLSSRKSSASNGGVGLNGVSRSLSKSSSSSETSPILESQHTRANSTTSLNSLSGSTSTTKKKSSEKPPTKKASHKLAEQGRRNRMNVAVHELSLLIPQNYHDEVAIPSKATTVELASRFIRDLIDEVENLKK